MSETAGQEPSGPSPAPHPVSASQTCQCGAAFSVSGMSQAATARALNRWRAAHRCPAPGGSGVGHPHAGGSGSAVIGFQLPDNPAAIAAATSCRPGTTTSR